MMQEVQMPLVCNQGLQTQSGAVSVKWLFTTVIIINQYPRNKEGDRMGESYHNPITTSTDHVSMCSHVLVCHCHTQ